MGRKQFKNVCAFLFAAVLAACVSVASAGPIIGQFEGIVSRSDDLVFGVDHLVGEIVKGSFFYDVSIAPSGEYSGGVNQSTTYRDGLRQTNWVEISIEVDGGVYEVAHEYTNNYYDFVVVQDEDIYGKDYFQISEQDQQFYNPTYSDTTAYVWIKDLVDDVVVTNGLTQQFSWIDPTPGETCNVANPKCGLGQYAKSIRDENDVYVENISFQFHVTSFSIGTAPVPEPPALLLLSLGLLVLELKFGKYSA